MTLLPAARNTNYVSGVTPVRGADINDLQDQVVSINNLVTGQPQSNWTNVTLAGNLTVGGQPFTFADFTFTADAGTDQLTATANPLQTGDGPLRGVNSGGALPGNFLAGTDYYWIYVDANHGRIATTRANALAGIFVDLSSNGTGTQTLQHQAGTTRISDSTVTRNLIVNGSMTIAGRAKQGRRTVRFPALLGMPQAYTSTWSRSVGGQGVSQVEPLNWTVPLLLPDGTRILEIRGRVRDNDTGSGTVVRMLVVRHVDDSVATLGTADSNGVGGALQTLTVTGLSETMAPPNTCSVEFVTLSGSNASDVLYVDVDVDDGP